MPIKIPNELPAVKVLNDENIFVMTETRAITQDIRPLKILLLNLMPKKIETFQEPSGSSFSNHTVVRDDSQYMYERSNSSKL